MDNTNAQKTDQTVCPQCQKPMPEETFRRSDNCPFCGKALHADTYQMALGIAAITTMVFVGLAAFSQDPHRWKFAGAMTAALALWASLVIVIDLMLIKFTKLPRSTRSWISMPVATAVFVISLFLWVH